MQTSNCSDRNFGQALLFREHLELLLEKSSGGLNVFFKKLNLKTSWSMKQNHGAQWHFIRLVYWLHSKGLRFLALMFWAPRSFGFQIPEGPRQAWRIFWDSGNSSPKHPKLMLSCFSPFPAIQFFISKALNLVPSTYEPGPLPLSYQFLLHVWTKFAFPPPPTLVKIQKTSLQMEKKSIKERWLAFLLPC